MSTPQPDGKCPACHRVTATHASGCSVIVCPNRHPQLWGGPDGAHGFPGRLAEDRIIQRDRAVLVNIEDL